jgi:hypothetical protein
VVEHWKGKKKTENPITGFRGLLLSFRTTTSTPA